MAPLPANIPAFTNGLVCSDEDGEAEEYTYLDPFGYDGSTRRLLPANIPATANGLNLSDEDSEAAKITFLESEKYDMPICAFEVRDPAAICVEIKTWLLATYKDLIEGDPGTVRMDAQQLEELSVKDNTTLLFAHGVAMLKDVKEAQIHVMALLTAGRPKIRWFYTVVDPTLFLIHLEQRNFIDGARHWVDDSIHWHRLLMFISHHFEHQIPIPHEPVYLRALQVMDYAPEIKKPDTALARLEAKIQLPEDFVEKELRHDRYRHKIHRAEVYLASICEINCAQYIMTKRVFFEKMYNAMDTDKVTLLAGRRVRTDYAHRRGLEEDGWKKSAAKRLVSGFGVLGLLDESFFIQWAEAGGMFEHQSF